MAGERTEKATPKKRQDERKKGNVLKSNEVVIAFSLLVTFFSLQLLMPSNISVLTNLIERYIALGATQTRFTVTYAVTMFENNCITFAQVALPILAISALTAIIVTMLQTRMLFSREAFKFKGERINPLSGFKKMFSMRSLIELLKSLIKIIVIIYVIYSVLRDQIDLLPRLMEASFLQAMSMTGELIMSVVLRAGAAFVFLAAIDYLYSWWEYEKNMRMTKQEIKDEYKQVEGDPQIKGRIRQMQQQRAQRRMMQHVPEADVVIRNPTHYAVAIKYDSDKSRAPVVIAKGADEVALRIVRTAEENDVYITQDKPLARALFETVDIDQEIPEDFYRAIAQVLAFVYSIKKKGNS